MWSKALDLPLVSAWHRFWTYGSIGSFYLGLIWVYADLGLPSVGAAFVAGGLFIGVIAAPLEYGLGAVAFTFLAACSARVGGLFQQLRWLFLAFAVVAFSLRFFLGKRREGPAAISKFSYLIALFLVVSAATMLTTVSVEFTALKLFALICIFYMSQRGGAHIVHAHAGFGARHLALGLLAYPLPLLALPVGGYFLHVGIPAHSWNGFSGYFANPNACGALIAIILPWIAGAWLNRSPGPLVLRVASLLALVSLGYVLLLTGSRSALLGVLVACGVFCCVHANRRVAAVVVLACVAVTARVLTEASFVPSLSERFLYKHKSRDRDRPIDALESRRMPWTRSINAFLANPWMGMGFGITSKAESDWALDVRSGSRAVETGSSFWGSLSQVGILGAVPLFLAILLLLLDAGRFMWRIKDPWLTGVYTSALAQAINAVFEGWLIAPGSFPTSYFWVQCFFLNALLCRYRFVSVKRVHPSLSQAPHQWALRQS